MTKKIAIVLAYSLIIPLLIACNGNVENGDNTVQTTEFRFDNGAEGFEPIFADFPLDGLLDSEGNDAYQMTHSRKMIPVAGAESYGLYISSINRSDDVFMGYVKEISELEANTQYTFQISFKLATDVEEGFFGVGDAPGDSVFVKAGVVAKYPIVGTAPDGHERILNVDKGNQSQSGKDLVVVGNIAKPTGSAEGFVFKNMGVERIATTNAEGQLFLIIGTDSGFEGFTEYYLDDISLRFWK